MSELADVFPPPLPPPTLVLVDEQAYDPEVLDQLPQVTKVVDFSYALSHLDELATEVERDEARIAVMRNGKPAFVMMNAEVMDWLEAHMEILMEPGAFDELRQSLVESAAGDTGVPWEEVAAELGLSHETRPPEA